MPDSPEVTTGKRLLDQARLCGFQFHRVESEPDGALLGTRTGDEWSDAVFLAGFTRDCYAVRTRTSSLVVTGGAVVERRAIGDALNVLNSVLTWPT